MGGGLGRAERKRIGGWWSADMCPTERQNKEKFAILKCKELAYNCQRFQPNWMFSKASFVDGGTYKQVHTKYGLPLNYLLISVVVTCPEGRLLMSCFLTVQVLQNYALSVGSNLMQFAKFM